MSSEINCADLLNRCLGQEWVPVGLPIAALFLNRNRETISTHWIPTSSSIAMAASHGSYWTGIMQRQIDPLTGLLLEANRTRYNLATRPGVPHNPIEGASLIHHGNFYYLFVSVDYCCEQNSSEDNYKQAVGRTISPHGPFVDENGTPMMGGGGTVLLKGNASWNAPGGGITYFDQESGESFLIFHAQNLDKDATPYQWLKTLDGSKTGLSSRSSAQITRS